MIDRFIKYFQPSKKPKPRVLQWVLLGGKKTVLSFLPLSQMPAAWLLTINLLPSFLEEKSLMKSFFCLLFSHLLKSLPIFSQLLRRFLRFETPMLFKNQVWIEKRYPNQCHHRRKGFRVRSMVTCFAQPAHADLLPRNPSWIRSTGGWCKSHDAAKEVGRLWKDL